MVPSPDDLAQLSTDLPQYLTTAIRPSIAQDLTVDFHIAEKNDGDVLSCSDFSTGTIRSEVARSYI